MAKPRCDKHKRSLPYCDACKEAVKAAEEAALQAERAAADTDTEDEEEASGKQAVLEEALREEESNALKAGVGFPGAQEESPASSPPADDVGEGPHVGVPPTPPEEPADWDKNVDQAEETFRAVPPIDETEEVMAEAGEFEFPNMGDGVPPCQREGAVEIDGDGNIVPAGCGDCGGECQGHADPGAAEFVMIEVTPQAQQLIAAIEKAIANGEEVTVVMGDAETRLRQEGRKEVIAMVREWFSDSMDTGAFKLLEHLEKKVR